MEKTNRKNNEIRTNNVDLKEENTMKKITNKIMKTIVYTVVFIVSAAISFLAVTAITTKKAAKDEKPEINKEIATDSLISTDSSADEEKKDTEILGEHEHVWESFGHTETINGKSFFVEDYQQCSICGERR
ncbi:MAG: hypothetical protein IJ224_05005 [Lachnospiraceae bacterium]|nr:hypothetical protein [Lachnospiraceae bacterium]